MTPPPPETVQRFTSGGFVEVDVGRIERDLSELWRTASSDEAVVTRACAWNLVYTLPGPAALDAARDRVDALVRRVPARVLLVCEAPPGDQGEPLAAWVSARCRRYGDQKVVCSEEITLSQGVGGGELVPPMLRALLVPDVPTAWLAHAGEPIDDPLLAPLLGEIDRVLVDSDRAGDDPRGFLDRIEGLVRRGRVVDLGWLRVAGLLSLFAALFDGPDGTTHLERASRVAICTAPGGLATGWLVAAWLATRLGWDVAARESDVRWFLSRRDGGTVDLSIVERDEAATPGLCELDVTTPAGAYRLARGEAEVALEAVGRAPRTVPRRRRHYDELVARALTSSQTLTVLREIVPVGRSLGG